MRKGIIRQRTGWTAVLLVLAGTTGAQTSFEISAVQCTTNYVQLTWASETGYIYTLERAGEPAATAHWQQVLASTADTNTLRGFDILRADMTSSFYRVYGGTNKVPAGSSLITYLDVTNVGTVAVRVDTPPVPRYGADGAGLVIQVGGFLGDSHGFNANPDFTRIGLIQVNCLHPGSEDSSGARSGGAPDYGGTNTVLAYREAIRFVSGTIPNRDGLYLHELIETTPLCRDVGLAALSHPGILAANILAFHGSQLTNVGYFVGWENPTSDRLVCFDAGSQHETTTNNPLYVYPDSYRSTNIVLPYERIWWTTNYEGSSRPFFDVNSNHIADAATDYVFSAEGSTMFGYRFYSRPVLQALLDNGALAASNWPADLAPTGLAQEVWAYRDAVTRYPVIATNASNVQVMLVLSVDDHAQPAADKPHVHQAYDGYRLQPARWVRLNPDCAYMEWAYAGADSFSPDNDANTQPGDWSLVRHWAYTNTVSFSDYAMFAGVAEMADRVYRTNWTVNLPSTLVVRPPP